MDFDRRPLHAPGPASRVTPVRDLSRSAAFEDSSWPAGVTQEHWLTAPAPTDPHRADVLAGRGMSVVEFHAGDCGGCVRDLVTRGR